MFCSELVVKRIRVYFAAFAGIVDVRCRRIFHQSCQRFRQPASRLGVDIRRILEYACAELRNRWVLTLVRESDIIETAQLHEEATAAQTVGYSIENQNFQRRRNRETVVSFNKNCT